MKFRVPVRFEAVGWIEVEASSAAEATALVSKHNPHYFDCWEILQGSLIVETPEVSKIEESEMCM